MPGMMVSRRSTAENEELRWVMQEERSSVHWLQNDAGAAEFSVSDSAQQLLRQSFAPSDSSGSSSTITSSAITSRLPDGRSGPGPAPTPRDAPPSQGISMPFEQGTRLQVHCFVKIETR